jgi:ketosteroid isomerase-like protein
MGMMERNNPVFCAAALALVLGLCSCGGTSNNPTSSSNTAATSHNTAATSQGVEPLPAATGPRGPGGILKIDGDSDADDRSKATSRDDQGEMVLPARLNSGSSAADKRAIEALVKRYLAAAAAGDGATGCSLLYSGLAAATAAQPGSPRPGQSACAAALSNAFAQERQHLAAEQVASMVVTGVHVNGVLGYVTLGFKRALESGIVVRREGRVWKMGALADSTLS